MLDDQAINDEIDKNVASMNSNNGILNDDGNLENHLKFKKMEEDILLDDIANEMEQEKGDELLAKELNNDNNNIDNEVRNIMLFIWFNSILM